MTNKWLKRHITGLLASRMVFPRLLTYTRNGDFFGRRTSDITTLRLEYD